MSSYKSHLNNPKYLLGHENTIFINEKFLSLDVHIQVSVIVIPLVVQLILFHSMKITLTDFSIAVHHKC